MKAISLLLFFFTTSVMQAQRVKPLQTGDPFPVINGELLSSEKITIPDDCMGKVSILIVAFRKDTQEQVNTWTTPILNEFKKDTCFRFIEIPMIHSFYAWMSHYIDSGMRKGIPKDMHHNVMTYYGSLSDYFRYFNVDDKKLCYLFLLDKNGIVHYLDKGKAEPNKLSALFQKTRVLLKD